MMQITGEHQAEKWMVIYSLLLLVEKQHADIVLNQAGWVQIPYDYAEVYWAKTTDEKYVPREAAFWSHLTCDLAPLCHFSEFIHQAKSRIPR